MLSEIETSGSATAFVGSDAVDETCTVLGAPGGALRLLRKGSLSPIALFEGAAVTSFDGRC